MTWMFQNREKKLTAVHRSLTPLSSLHHFQRMLHLTGLAPA
jgi:hypothetical protein